MKIGIIGNGVVGRATARSYLEHVEEVRVHDVLPERRTHGLSEVLDCGLDTGLVFVCLPTPAREDGRCDVSFLDDFFAGVNLVRLDGHKINFVLRSTVPIGTTCRLAETYKLPNLVHSPEFLTARCAVTDAQLPARNIVGIPKPRAPLGSLFIGDNRAGQTLNILYHQRFPGVPVHLMSSDESEAVKLFQNSFFAVKIALWNECRAYATKVGLDWEQVMKAILADGRIAHSHTAVPGPDGKFGFGGSCLPKDLANLIHCIEQAGPSVRAYLLKAARLRNDLLDRRAAEIEKGA